MAGIGDTRKLLVMAMNVKLVSRNTHMHLSAFVISTLFNSPILVCVTGSVKRADSCVYHSSDFAVLTQRIVSSTYL